MRKLRSVLPVISNRKLGEDRSCGRRLECERADRRIRHSEQLRQKSESYIGHHDGSIRAAAAARSIPSPAIPRITAREERLLHLPDCRGEPGRRLVDAWRGSIDERRACDAQHEQRSAGELNGAANDIAYLIYSCKGIACRPALHAVVPHAGAPGAIAQSYRDFGHSFGTDEDFGTALHPGAACARTCSRK